MYIKEFFICHFSEIGTNCFVTLVMAYFLSHVQFLLP